MAVQIEEENVHEGMSLEPLTDYSKFKADCEKILANYHIVLLILSLLLLSDQQLFVVIRRVKGLDVVVNILNES
jgi:hypothetical protein